MQEPVTKGRFECPFDGCPDRFDTLGDKRRHLRDSHPETKRRKRHGAQ